MSAKHLFRRLYKNEQLVNLKLNLSARILTYKFSLIGEKDCSWGLLIITVITRVQNFDSWLFVSVVPRKPWGDTVSTYKFVKKESY